MKEDTKEAARAVVEAQATQAAIRKQLATQAESTTPVFPKPEPLLTAREKACPPPPPPDRTPQTTEFWRELKRTEGGTKKGFSPFVLIDGRQPEITNLKLALSCVKDYEPLALDAD